MAKWSIRCRKAYFHPYSDISFWPATSKEKHFPVTTCHLSLPEISKYSAGIMTGYSAPNQPLFNFIIVRFLSDCAIYWPLGIT